jgi:hypothetical protein
MSNVLTLEDDFRLWEQAAEQARIEGAKMREPYERAEREKARLKAEQEASEAKRRAELFISKSTLAYSEPLAIEICERISSGELLINICADEHMPTVRRVTQWLNESVEFKGLYGASINDRLNIFEEEIIQISDDVSRDFKNVVRNGRSTRVLDGEAIARAKLRVEMRLKHLRAYRPERWSEQSTLNLKQDDGFDPASMSAEELEKTIAAIEHKNRIVRAA